MNMAVNMAELAFAEWQAEAERSRQKEVLRSRDYLDGTQIVPVLSEINSLLGLPSTATVELRLNIIRPIINAVTERLNVQTIEHENAAVRDWAARVFRANELNVRQTDVHRSAINDGEAFVMVDWDEVRRVPRFLVHPRYVDTGSAWQIGGGGGDGFGCRVVYENNDPWQPVRYVAKRWREELGGGQTRLRMNHYYPDRVEKYAAKSLLGDMGWQEHMDPKDKGVWPLPWLDAKGEPLGIPVVSFSNPDERPEARDAWGPQDAVIMGFQDLIANSRTSAFRIYKAFGFMPTTDGQAPKADGSNALHIRPGSIIGANKPPADAAFDALDGSDSKPFIESLNAHINWAAVVTDTPVTRFQQFGQLPRAETQAEYNEALYAKVETRQLRFGNSWARVFEMALGLQNTFGDKVSYPEGSEMWASWAPARKRTVQEQAAEADAKLRSRIPEETIWREVWGYSDADIADMKQEESYQRRVEAANANAAALGGLTNG